MLQIAEESKNESELKCKTVDLFKKKIKLKRAEEQNQKEITRQRREVEEAQKENELLRKAAEEDRKNLPRID